MSDQGSTVMDRLRVSTAGQHEAAEHHAFQRALAKGRVTREGYAGYLGQMLLVHRALEGRLRDARERCVAVATVVKDWQLQEGYLAADLVHLGVELRSIGATPSTAAFIAEVNALPERTDADLRLLGMHYVLEGSNNGSKFISMNIGRSLGLTAEGGMRYLDPYGDDQRERWAEFKRLMLGIGFEASEVEEIVAGAGAMFDWISRVSDDLAEAYGVLEDEEDGGGDGVVTREVKAGGNERQVEV